LIHHINGVFTTDIMHFAGHRPLDADLPRDHVDSTGNPLFAGYFGLNGFWRGCRLGNALKMHRSRWFGSRWF
jgi:hypothetical protein